MPNLWDSLQDGFMPHGFCLKWDGPLLMVFIIGNLGIAIAYFLIPIALRYFIGKRKDLPYIYIFRLFAAFILSCGMTHILKVWTIYQPVYWVEAMVDLWTALVSLLTAGLLFPLIPQALALRSPKALEEANRKLEEEIRKQAAAEQKAEDARREAESGNIRARRAEENFRALLEFAPDAMIITNKDGAIIQVNLRTEKLFGYKRDEILGLLIETLIPESTDQHSAMVMNNPGNSTVDLYGLRKDGSEFPVEVSLGPLKTDEGVLVCSAVRDITQRKQMTENIRRSNQELQQFAYIVSHDLQEPLRSISSFGDLLNESCNQKLDPQESEFITIILDSSKRMQQLITDLLAFSRVERMGVPLAPVAIIDAVEDAKLNLRALLAESKAEINVGKLPVVSGDHTQLTQLFQNLIGNAVKYNRSGKPVVEVSCDEQPAEWIISVRDNGIGFEMKFAERIFEPFQRLHAASKYSGTGIGLAICKKIVLRHGGKIWAESNKEGTKGSTFFISIPKAKEKVSS